ncbi:GntR family transcriptional regulator [Actinophytocola xinjiangensis]|uniref:GntR family transcriptional regulator n=1 Tax=Actinophytocola xinjiangensis TaxID=485602 RepID=A0A7Z0WTG5_9PSEU|nr:GntR family transcriptional regulator [Actinophytocola xinjiangensis]OLF14164.1 GntR family transcriptional regulator [Actinophytocola xinjiangensis]
MGSRPLRRERGTTLWVQLLADLRRRLAEGEFTDAFPGELAIAEDYGVSRHTVRQALGELRADGTVTAARGRTPRVSTTPEIQQPLGTLYSLFAAVEATGVRQRSVVHALDTRADGVIAARLGLEESTPLVYLERLRLADGEPLAVDRAWLPHDLAAPLLDVDFSRTALYTEFADRCGVRLTSGTEHLRAVIPFRGERLLLGLDDDPPSVAAFAIDRLGRAGGRPVEWRHTVVRGDLFSVTAELPTGTGFQVLASTPRPAYSA